MYSLDVINELTVASPCSASWNAMKGDDRARFCSTCEKHVYNIAAMRGREVEELILRTEGRFCARLYRRRDGTVLTGDCPVGAKAFGDRRFHRALTLVVLGLGILMMYLLHLRSRELEMPPAPPTGPGVTQDDWTDWAMEILRLRPRTPSPRLTAGEPAPVPMLGKLALPPACNVPSSKAR